MFDIKAGVVKLERRIDWGGLLLALAAVWFLTLGTPMKDETDDAVALAFTGAAVTRIVDVASERRKDRAAAAERRARDLDETRRLLYAVLALPGAPQHGLMVASAANALAHHGTGVPIDEAVTNLTAVANGGTASQASECWIRDRIVEITRQLDDGKG
jgi:hypothetical protein